MRREALRLDLGRSSISPLSNDQSPSTSTPSPVGSEEGGVTIRDASELRYLRMADLRELYKNKYVVFIGDSVMRCMYYDFITALQQEEICGERELKGKGVNRFKNDVLLFRTKLWSDRYFNEVREYASPDCFHCVRFYFTTRCINIQVMRALYDFKHEESNSNCIKTPDIVFMNSCLWDLCRYGPDSQKLYHVNLNRLCGALKRYLPPESLFVWLTATPCANQLTEQIVPKEIQFLCCEMRQNILEGNHYASQVMTGFGYDVLDIHFYLRSMQKAHRLKDGVHWDATVHRYLTHIMAMHVYNAFNLNLPKRTVDLFVQIRDSTGMDDDDVNAMFKGQEPEYVELRAGYLDWCAEWEERILTGRPDDLRAFAALLNEVDDRIVEEKNWLFGSPTPVGPVDGADPCMYGAEAQWLDQRRPESTPAPALSPMCVALVEDGEAKRRRVASAEEGDTSPNKLVIDGITISGPSCSKSPI